MRLPFIRLCWVMGLLCVAAMMAPAHAQSPSAVVLMYHRFGESTLPSTSIRLDQLENHIAALQSGGQTVVPLDHVVAALRGERDLPDRAVAITVDDAYRSFLTQGWPRFKAAGFPVTLFVATAGVDAGYSDLLTWDEVRALQADGVIIGAHSHSHGHYPAMSADAVADDLAQAKASFVSELGRIPTLFAFPYGEAGQADLDMVKAAGFTAAFGQHSGAAGPLANPLYLPRFSLNESFGNAARFRLIADTLPLPITSIDPIESVLTENPPVLTLSLTDPPTNIAALTCFGPGGTTITSAVDAGGVLEQVWITPDQVFPTGRVRVNCTLPARGAGQEGRWYWFGWQMIAGFETEGVPVHARYR